MDINNKTSNTSNKKTQSGRRPVLIHPDNRQTLSTDLSDSTRSYGHLVQRQKQLMKKTHASKSKILISTHPTSNGLSVKTSKTVRKNVTLCNAIYLFPTAIDVQEMHKILDLLN